MRRRFQTNHPAAEDADDQAYSKDFEPAHHETAAAFEPTSDPTSDPTSEPTSEPTLAEPSQLSITIYSPDAVYYPRFGVKVTPTVQTWGEEGEVERILTFKYIVPDSDTEYRCDIIEQQAAQEDMFGERKSPSGSHSHDLLSLLTYQTRPSWEPLI